MCLGTSQEGDKQALMEWLDDALEYISGRIARRGELHGDGRRPLTFGDLKAKSVHFAAMTTCLSDGAPYSLPFRNKRFAFRRDALGRVLPKHVVKAMVDSGEPLSEGIWSLPAEEDTPVLFAVRLSLSFPLLFSAVPLVTRDFTRKDEPERQQPRDAWFSDGGLCANLPIHFFDALIPTRPTIALTLEPKLHRAERFVVGGANLHGVALRPMDTPGHFASALLDVMQEWRDELQCQLPGYRDRVTRIRLDKGEGGLNLDMTEDQMEALMSIGHKAGEAVATQFDWEGHRWTRYLAAMDQVSRLLGTLEAREQDIGHLLSTASEMSTRKRSKRWVDIARASTTELIELSKKWGLADNNQSVRFRFENRAPRPLASLRPSPSPMDVADAEPGAGLDPIEQDSTE